jgi:hypothetical protein
MSDVVWVEFFVEEPSMREYSDWLPDDWRIVVVRDEDRKDCRKLKAQIEKIARDA